MKKILTFITILVAFASISISAKPTRYVEGTWYECDQYDYDSKGKKIHTTWSDSTEYWYDYDAKGNVIHESHLGYLGKSEYWYKWFGSKKSGKELKCNVTSDGTAKR